MSGPHDDVEKENTRLRKEVRLLKEEYPSWSSGFSSPLPLITQSAFARTSSLRMTAVMATFFLFRRIQVDRTWLSYPD
jgi:hypothetical protein